MRPFRRHDEPSILVEHGARWTAAWLARGGGFRWPQHERIPVNQHLEPLLLAQTDDHCSYCDHFPLRVEARPEIDHFQPNSRFPELGFAWTHLYAACRSCNGAKLEQWNPALLRPDEPGYDFWRYFEFETRTGRLLPRADADAADQQRASVTIDVFGFNDGNRPHARLRAIHAGLQPDGPYRFLG